MISSLRSLPVLLLAMHSTLLFTTAMTAQEKKPDETPRVLMCVPLGVLPGATTKVFARGIKLEGATEVKASDARLQVKLLSQGKANVPNGQNPQKVGDNQVEFELIVSGEFPAGNAEITLVTPQGEVKCLLPVGGDVPAIAEKEPNPGFKQSQAIALPQIVIGHIENANDVDVYSFDVAVGQKVVCEVFSARLGSAVDAVLTVYDATGRIVAISDDLPDTPDARLEFTASIADKFYVSVQDAHDLGGPAHPYRLSVK